MPQHKSKFCRRFKTATSFCVCQFIGRTNFKIESYPFKNTESFQYFPIFQLFRRLNTRLCCSPLSRQPCFYHTRYAFTHPPSLRISICNAQAWCAEQFNYVRHLLNFLLTFPAEMPAEEASSDAFSFFLIHLATLVLSQNLT